MITLNCKGRLFTAEQPVVMGILNATPDSFYTKGSYNSREGILQKAEEMLQDGAAILDIGGMSTRPGAPDVSQEEEFNRVIPVIREIRRRFPDCFISVDTYRSALAREAVREGADIVNDISSGSMDPQMLTTVGSLDVPYIAMHMLGTPATMQQNPAYQDITSEILGYFTGKAQECAAAGIKDLILDPGFGFGKTMAHNYQLLKGLHTLRVLEKPVLAGISRKSMVYKLLNTDAEHALNGSTAVHMLALQQGAQLLRVHDVKEAAECIQLFHYYQTI